MMFFELLSFAIFAVRMTGPPYKTNQSVLSGMPIWRLSVNVPQRPQRGFVMTVGSTALSTHLARGWFTPCYPPPYVGVGALDTFKNYCTWWIKAQKNCTNLSAADTGTDKKYSGVLTVGPILPLVARAFC